MDDRINEIVGVILILGGLTTLAGGVISAIISITGASPATFGALSFLMLHGYPLTAPGAFIALITGALLLGIGVSMTE